MIVYHSIQVTVGSDGPIYFDSVRGVRVALGSFITAGRSGNMEKQTW